MAQAYTNSRTSLFILLESKIMYANNYKYYITSMLFIIYILILGINVQADVKLANEEKIIVLGHMQYNWKNKSLGAAQLSPNGKWLLYMKTSEDSYFRLALYDIEKRKEITLTSYYPDSTQDLFLRLLSTDLFNANSTELIYYSSDDPDKNGKYSQTDGIIHPYIFNLEYGRSKVIKLPQPYLFVMASYEKGTSNIICVTITKEYKTNLYYISDYSGLKKMPWPNGSGINYLQRSSGHGKVALYNIDIKNNRSYYRIYDLRKRVITCTVALHKQNRKTDEYPPQWAEKGKYLLLVDNDIRDTSKYNTKIVNTLTEKIFLEVPDCGPAAPGPNNSTVFLLQRGHNSSEACLYDVKTCTLHSFKNKDFRFLSSSSKWIVYGIEKDENLIIFKANMEW